MRTESLLTRNQSNYIKGILILLIVLGHNSVLMHLNAEDIWLKNWLYSFHVKSFLFLPFLYDIKRFRISSIRKSAKRLLTPYTIFFIILLIINYLNTHDWNILIIIQAYITGSQTLLQETTGLIYIWFLPTMFSILILKDFTYTHKKIKILSFIIGLCILILQIMYLAHQEIGEYTPLGLYLAIQNFPLALALRWYLVRAEKIKQNLIFFLCVTCILTGIWFLLHPQKYLWSISMFILFPLTIFPLIFYLSKFSENNSIISRVLIFLGKISMGIYLIHQILYNVIFKLTNSLLENNCTYGVSLFILTLVTTLIVVLGLRKISPNVYRIVF